MKIITRIREGFDRLTEVVKQRLQDRVFMFRLFVTVIAIDFVAFLTLGSINPLQLVNPARFLWSAPADDRPMVELYFPRSFDRLQTDQKGAAPSSIDEMIIKVAQRAELPAERNPQGDAMQILHELSLGPTNLQARRFFRDRDLLRSVWFHGGVLVLHIDEQKWQRMTPEDQKLARVCIEKSMMANLREVTRVEWQFS